MANTRLLCERRWSSGGCVSDYLRVCCSQPVNGPGHHGNMTNMRHASSRRSAIKLPTNATEHAERCTASRQHRPIPEESFGYACAGTRHLQKNDCLTLRKHYLTSFG